MSLPQIPGFNIERLLGRGGMGSVYYAYPILDTGGEGFPVALKTFEIDSNTDEADIARFRREFQVVSKLSHPNLVPVFQHGETPTLSWFTMELVEGVTLNRYFQDRAGGAPLDELLPLMIQLTEALHYVHQQGVLHRDLKPQNVLVQSDGMVRLLDFGLSLKGGASRLTQTNQSLGTPLYMSPESIRGEDADARTDIYSVGVIFYELLAGRSPFAGDTFALLFQILNAPIPGIEDLVSLPSPAARLINKMMDRDRDQRPNSMGEVLKVLRSLTGAESGIAHSLSLANLPLLGRENEINELSRWVEQGRHTLVWSGIGQGKTRVLRALAAVYRSKSLPVLELQGAVADAAPLEALWVGCARLGCLDSFPAWVRRAFQLDRPRDIPSGEGESAETAPLTAKYLPKSNRNPTQLYLAITRTLQNHFCVDRFESNQWYVLVDDLEQLDRVTRALVQFWLLAPKGHGPLVVATARKTINKIYPKTIGPFHNLSLVELPPLPRSVKLNLVNGWLGRSLHSERSGVSSSGHGTAVRLAPDVLEILEPQMNFHLRFLEEALLLLIGLGCLAVENGLWVLTEQGRQRRQTGEFQFASLDDLYTTQSTQLTSSERIALQVLAYCGRFEEHWREVPCLSEGGLTGAELDRVLGDLVQKGWLRSSPLEEVYMMEESRRTFVRSRTSAAVIDHCIEWDLQCLAQAAPALTLTKRTHAYERLYRFSEQSPAVLQKDDWLPNALEDYHAQFDTAQSFRLWGYRLQGKARPNDEVRRAAQVALTRGEGPVAAEWLSMAYPDPNTRRLQALAMLQTGQVTQALTILSQALEHLGLRPAATSGAAQKMLAWMKVAGRGLGWGSRMNLDPAEAPLVWDYLECLSWARPPQWEVDYLEYSNQLQKCLLDESRPDQVSANQEYQSALSTLLLSQFSRSAATLTAQKHFRAVLDAAVGFSNSLLRDSLLKDAGLMAVYSGDLSGLKALDELWDGAVVRGEQSKLYLTRGLTIFEWIRIGRIRDAETAIAEMQSCWNLHPGSLLAQAMLLLNQAMLYLHRDDQDGATVSLESACFEAVQSSPLLEDYRDRATAWLNFNSGDFEKARQICSRHQKGGYVEDRFRHSDKLYWRQFDLLTQIWSMGPNLVDAKAKSTLSALAELRNWCFDHYPGYRATSHRLEGVVRELQGRQSDAIAQYQKSLEIAGTAQLPIEEYFCLSRLMALGLPEHVSHLEATTRVLTSEGLALNKMGLSHPQLA